MNNFNVTLKIAKGCLHIDTSLKADGYAWPEFLDRCQEYWWLVWDWSFSWHCWSRHFAWLMMPLSLLLLLLFLGAERDRNLCHLKECKNSAWRVRQENFIHLKAPFSFWGAFQTVVKICKWLWHVRWQCQVEWL